MLRRYTIALAFSAVAFVIFACAGSQPPALPQVQTIVVKTDADARAAIAKTYDALDLSIDIIIKAKRFEEKFQTDLPASAHASFVTGANDVLKAIRQLVQDIDGKVVTTWAAVQARVTPIVGQLNALLQIVSTKGFSFMDAIGAAVNLLAPLLVPGLPRLAQ